MATRSLITKTTVFRRPFIAAVPSTSLSRTITGTSRASHKESTSQHPDAQVDKHKVDSLKKQKEGKGHWKPELASDSEEAVKADRSGPKESASDAMKRLQERTKAAAEETSKSGTSMHDDL